MLAAMRAQRGATWLELQGDFRLFAACAELGGT